MEPGPSVMMRNVTEWLLPNRLTISCLLASFAELHPVVEIDGRLVGNDVGRGRILPHSELDEDVRRHVQRVRR